MRYVEVALNVPLNQTFTYSTLPDDTEKVSLKEQSLELELDLIKTKKTTVKTFSPEIGKRAEVKFGNRRLTGIIVKTFDQLPKDLPYDASKIRPLIRVLDEQPVLTQELISLGIWMSGYYLTPIGEILNSMIPSGKRETDSSSFSFTEEFPEQKIVELSKEQIDAIDAITKAGESEHKYHYLYGTTGSGKTEVFLQVAENILKKGKGIIYLVPEIGLTPQVIEAVTIRFGSTVAVLHS